MRKGGRKLLVASLGVGAISYVACGGISVANLMAPPQQDAGAEHPPDATQDGTTEMPDTGPEPRRTAALGRPVAQEPFELELYGDNVERRFRRIRPEVVAMPWGTFDTRAAGGRRHARAQAVDERRIPGAPHGARLRRDAAGALGGGRPVRVR